MAGFQSRQIPFYRNGYLNHSSAFGVVSLPFWGTETSICNYNGVAQRFQIAKEILMVTETEIAIETQTVTDNHVAMLFDRNQGLENVLRLAGAPLDGV